ncbi:MAG: serine/threonine-protein kinase [Pseudomonadota bacterium]
MAQRRNYDISFAIDMDINEIAPGTIISRNRIEQKIGSGGSGVVYLATDLESKRKVALKFLNKEMLGDKYSSQLPPELSQEEVEKKVTDRYESIANRFKMEYQKQLTGAHHPNIAKVYQFDHFEDYYFFTSEYIEGKTIFRALASMSPDQKVPFFIQMLEGLQFIHDNNLLHGDIKPENVLVHEENGKAVVKIIDFGIASEISNKKKKLAGTPMYIAPEVILASDQKTGVASDLFSAAVLMYYCLVSEHPFLDRHGWDKDIQKLKKVIKEETNPPRPREQIEQIPEYLDTIVMRLLERNPDDRFYGSARAVINALKTRCPNDFKENPEVKSSYLIPDHLIGHDAQMKEINKCLNLLKRGKQPQTAIFYVTGRGGLGKTHFLSEIRKSTEKEAGKISLHSIKFPVDDDWALLWTNELTKTLEENKLPLLLLIDDTDQLKSTHAIYKTILNFVHNIRQRIANPQLFGKVKPVMLCFTSKDTIPSIRHIPQKTIELKPFTEKDIQAYLKSTIAFRNKKISRDWIVGLSRQTNGIPKEIYEHLVELDSKGLLFDLDGNVHLAETVTSKVQQAIPKSTKNRILKLYNDLSPNEKLLADFISAWYYKWISPPLTIDDLQQFFPTTSLNQHIHSLCRKEIFTQSEEGNNFTFVNPYMPELIYKKLDEKDRFNYHNSIAKHLKKLTDYENAMLFHHGLSSSKANAISSLVRLSKRLILDGNIHLAQDLLANALNRISPEMLSFRIYNHSLLIHTWYYAGKFPRATDLYDKTWKMLNYGYKIPPILKLHLFASVLPSFIELKEFDKAMDIISIGYKIAEPAKFISYYIYFLNSEGKINFKRRLEDKRTLLQAKKLYLKSKKFERKVKKTNLSLTTNNELGYVLLAMGKTAEAIDEIKHELKKCEAGKNVIKIMLANLELAECLRLTRKFSQSIKYATRALALAKKISHDRWLVHAHRILAGCYFDWKKYDKSIEENQHCLMAATCLSDKKEHDEITDFVWTTIGNCYNEMQEWKKSPKYFEAVLEHENDNLIRVRAKQGLAEASLYLKKPGTSKFELSEVDSMLTRFPTIPDDYRFINNLLKYKVLVREKKKDEALLLLPALKKYADNNPYFLKELRKISG